MRVVAIVQSRFGSSRLPGKALMAMRGHPLLAHVLHRVSAMTTLDEVILATTHEERDTALVSVAASCGVRTYRGSQYDVMGRFVAAAEWAEADIIVRVTGDCPLFCSDLGDKVFDLYSSFERDDIYAWNDTLRSGYPDGTDVEVFSLKLLKQAHATVHPISPLREHVTGPLRAIASHVATYTLAQADYSALKLSVDRPEDYERVCAVAQHLGLQQTTWADLLKACVRSGVLAHV